MTSSRSDNQSAACRVVITGIGLWTPLGSDRESTWRELLAGHSASCWLQPPQWTGNQPLAGAPCSSPHSDDANRLDEGERLDPVIALARRSSEEAVRDAGFEPTALSSERTGVVFGTSKGGLHTASRFVADGMTTTGSWMDVWPDAAARHLAARYDCRGPVLAPVLACATGLAACQRAFELIRDGVCDVVLAGSSDASLQPAILGSFQRLGVMARPIADPASACRPFDRHRKGFVVGEGAACLVLESLSHAQRRAARWYGEWLTGRMLSDATSLTQLDPEGRSLKRLLRDVQRDVPLRPDYVNMHGTATMPNDRVETAAILDLFGSDARAVSYSSLKGGLGHLLGAAGSVELAATLLAIRDQIVPPTANLSDPDPELGLDFTPLQARPKSIERAWKLSLGFGGHLSAACVGRLRGDGDRVIAAG